MGYVHGVRKGVVALAVVVFCLGWVAALPPAAARRGYLRYVVAPNGSDDTADLQAAFDACTAAGSPCTVQLESGTYYTAQITVFGFRGNFVGRGQGSTVIQALPNLPSPAPEYNTPTSPFWAGLPGPANPWPDLFTFVNGTFRMSGMTITEPYAYPDQGYYNAQLGGTENALWAAILVTGEQASAAIDHVNVIGAAGDISITGFPEFTFNLFHGILYRGMFLPAGFGDPLADQIPVSGTFTLVNSAVEGGVFAAFAENVLDAAITMCWNSIDSTPNVGFADASNSRIRFCGNTVTNAMVGAGLEGFQGVFKSDLLPSAVTATGNYIGVNNQSSGIVFADFGTIFFGTSSTLSGVAADNVVVTDMSCGCYLPGYITLGAAGLTVFRASGNTVYGGGAGIFLEAGPGSISGNTVIGSLVGIWLYAVNGAHVTGNTVRDSPLWGIAVTWGVEGVSSNNRIAGNRVTNSGAFDLYWDENGTGNVWHGNSCQTSSPPGLCSSG